MEWIRIVTPPALMVLGGIITWFIKDRTEELRAVEARLADDRRRIYGEILEPYVRLFTAVGSTQNQQKASQQMLSFDYRKTAFQLILFGDDSVVKAYNRLMQHMYTTEATGSQLPSEMMRLWGLLLLEIRRSVGNRKTDMDEWGMLEWMIKDMDSIKP